MPEIGGLLPMRWTLDGWDHVKLLSYWYLEAFIPEKQKKLQVQ